ncbi:LysR family transcriptional regulator [Azospirillum sp. sgz302134]
MNIRSIDLNLIIALAALLEERNVSRAADRIGRSQPATSSALARLREIFDDPLLVRDGKGYRLTPRAEEVRVHAARALAALTATFQGHEDFDPATAEMVVRIAASDYLAAVLMPRLIATLGPVAPGIDLRVVAADRHSAIALLREGKADLSLAVTDDRAPEVQSLPLFEEEFAMVTRPGHPYHDGPPTPERFTEHPGLLVSQAGDGTGVADECLARLGLKRRVAVTVAHFLLAPQLVAGSDLVLVIGRRVAETASANLNLRVSPLPFSMPTFTARMFWHASTDKYPPLAWVRSLIAGLDLAGR